MPFQKGNKEASKKGKHKKTIEKEVALQELRQGILKEILPILRAALDSAKGLTVMYQRKLIKKGDKFVREGELVQVVDQNRVRELLEGDCQGDDWYYITTKDPNIQAIKELWDRAFGKTQESMDLTSGGKPLELVISDCLANRYNLKNDAHTKTTGDNK